MSVRLAIVSTHPVQYYAPWFRHLAAQPELDLRVYYLWDFGVTEQRDAGFGVALRWDLPLLEGYAHEFVPNVARDPGTHHPAGIDNPSLPTRLAEFTPHAVLLMGYHYRSLLRLLRAPPAPLLLRGDSHDLVPTSRRFATLRRWAQRWLFRKVHAALPVGRANHAYWRARGFAADRLHAAPHCVDNARFAQSAAASEAEAQQLRSSLGLTDADRLVVFAGKFEAKKQPLALLDGFLRLDPARTHLLLVGDGPQRAALEARAGAHPRVHGLPFQNQTRMPVIYRAADLYVLPSVGGSETWGLAVNEAMACGTAVLVSTHVGCQADLVEDGVTGYVCEAGDASSLQATLLRALNDDQARAAIAAAGHTRVQTYDFAHASAGVLAALRGVPGVSWPASP